MFNRVVILCLCSALIATPSFAANKKKTSEPTLQVLAKRQTSLADDITAKAESAKQSLNGDDAKAASQVDLIQKAADEAHQAAADLASASQG